MANTDPAPVVQDVAKEVGQDAVKAAESVVPAPVVKFFDSALGQSVEVLLWTAGAFLLTVLGGWLAKVHFNDGLVALGVPGLLNWIIYSLRVIADSKVPNLPKSN